MTTYEHLTDERAVRAEALDAAALSITTFAKHMTTTYSTRAPEKERGGVSGVIRMPWDGQEVTPAKVSEGRSSQIDDFLLRAARWIVAGHDTEVDEEGE